MDFISQYGLFLLKSLTIVISLLLLFAGIMALGKKPKPKLHVEPLNTYYEELKAKMWQATHNKKLKKTREEKKLAKASADRPNLFLIEFHGDMKASQVEGLRETITAILTVAKEKDEVVVLLESPGGAVNTYGLATSQLQRLREHRIPLTICIDKVAASGGYLMACIADKILAAPFAYVGSIGVVSQIPNFHRWLKKRDIDVELMTAGEYKRTLTLLGENTEKAREKFQEDLEKIHTAFRNVVLQNRQQLDIDVVATGEYWLAVDALPLKLVDELKTSDSFITEKLSDFNILKVTVPHKQSFLEKLLKPAANLLGLPATWS